jgi:type I restriction-modification system DNA methylase subunit
MPVDKQVLLRYQVLNKCFRNRYRDYTIDDLVDECNKALRRMDKPDVSKRTIQNDIDIPGYCHGADFDEINGNDYSLVPSKYIKFDAQDNQEDYATRMKQLQAELSEVMKEEADSRDRLMALFDELGYKIELV